MRGYPTLILLSGSGALIAAEGREVVVTDPHGERFPWRAPDPPETLVASLEHHHVFHRFLRKEDVNGLAGPAKKYPDFVPIDFLLIPERATNLQVCKRSSQTFFYYDSF